MSRKSLPTTLGVMLLIIAALGRTSTVRAQPTDAPASVQSPEDMVEEALRKLDEGEFQAANALFTRAQRSKPDMVRLKLLQGLLYIEANRAPEAISLLEEFNRDAGNEFRGFYAVGKVYNASLMYRQAIRPLERAKNFAPPELNGKNVKAEIAIELAAAYKGRNLPKEALKYADEAAALAPNDPGIQLKLGQMNLKTQDYASALRATEKAVSLLIGQLRADPFKLENNKLLKDSHDLRVSILEAQRAADPDDANIYFALSRAMRDSADANRRISLLTSREYALEALNKDAKLYTCSVFLARLEWELGGSQDALDRLKNVLAEDPNNADASSLREQIQASLRQTSEP